MEIVVPKKGEELMPEEVINFCTKHLVSHKKPTSVEILDALPKTTSAKIQKVLLREKYGKAVRYWLQSSKGSGGNHGF